MAEAASAGLGLDVELRQAGTIPLDIKFSVAAGEFMALAGPSGSGKTTILRAIAGLYRPANGKVACNGASWLDTDRRIDVPTRQRRVGLVFQSYALFPHLTAVQNVAEAMRDRPAAVRREEARALLARVHLANFEERRPSQLSGGQQQRVAVARALARRPDVLLLDEPFSAVDRATRERLYVELSELRSLLAMPVILVTHDLDEAARLADTATLISAGAAIANGPIEAVLSRLDLGDYIERETFGAVIHARIVGHDEEAGITFLDHPAGRLFLPLIASPAGTGVRLRIRARDVALAVGELGRLSIRNRLSATVVEIAEGTPPLVTVRLDIGGDPLIAAVTRDAATELGLEVGLPVTALVKTVALDRSPAANVQNWK